MTPLTDAAAGSRSTGDTSERDRDQVSNTRDLPTKGRLLKKNRWYCSPDIAVAFAGVARAPAARGGVRERCHRRARPLRQSVRRAMVDCVVVDVADQHSPAKRRHPNTAARPPGYRGEQPGITAREGAPKVGRGTGKKPS